MKLDEKVTLLDDLKNNFITDFLVFVGGLLINRDLKVPELIVGFIN